VYLRVFDGVLRTGDTIRMVSNNALSETMEVGYFRLEMIPSDELRAGEVGYVHTGIKNIRDTRVGDTVTRDADPCDDALPGFREVKPMVFTGLYPMNPTITRGCAKLSKSSSSTIRRLPSSPKHRRPSGLASAAVFWASPHGGHTGKAGARVLGVAHYDDAQREVSHRVEERRGSRSG